MSTTNEPIDLMRFCGEGGVLDNPFVRDGYKVATDGRILAGYPVNEPDSEGVFPISIRSLLDFDRDTCTTEPLPLPPNECKKCEGSGEQHFVVCDECEGDGVIECDHCYHESNCDSCRGNGRLPAKAGDRGKIEVDLCECMYSRVEVMPNVGLRHDLAKKTAQYSRRANVADGE